MKKILSLLACLWLLAGMVTSCGRQPLSSVPTDTPSSGVSEAGSAPTEPMPVIPVPSPGDVMLFDFEDGNAKVFAQQDLSAYGVTLSPMAITDAGSDTGKGFRVSLDGDAGRWCQALTAPMPKAFADCGDYRYLRVWVRNDGGSPLSVGVILSGNGATGSLDSRKAVVTRCDGTVIETATDDAAGSGRQDHVRVPAGFAGWIALPLEEAALPILTAPVITDFASAAELKLDIRPGGAADIEQYVLDDICLTDSEKGVERMFTGYVPPALADIKAEIESGLAAGLTTKPVVQYWSEYDPKTSASGINRWSNIKALTFDGAAMNGSKTRVFGYIGYPEGDGKAPAVVLLHGGGGHAFAEWIKKWTDRGYVAIAFDNTGYFPTAAGKGLAGRESDPAAYWSYGMTDDFRADGYVNAPTNSGMNDAGKKADQQWMYHAVAQTIQAHNILREDPRVDASRIGITGISWGGVITSLAIGYDNRYAFAIPIYGSGYLEEALSFMGPPFSTPECRAVWSAQERFSKVSCPVLWVGWNSDNAFSINSNSKSYLDTRGNDRTLLAMINQMGHGHSLGWNPAVSYRYADWIVNDGKGLSRFVQEPSGRTVDVSITRPNDVSSLSAKIYYVTEKITYSKKPDNVTTTMDQTWQTAACTVSGDRVTGKVPAGAYGYYVEVMMVTPEGNCMSTSSFVTLE